MWFRSRPAFWHRTCLFMSIRRRKIIMAKAVLYGKHPGNKTMPFFLAKSSLKSSCNHFWSSSYQNPVLIQLWSTKKIAHPEKHSPVIVLGHKPSCFSAHCHLDSPIFSFHSNFTKPLVKKIFFLMIYSNCFRCADLY